MDDLILYDQFCDFLNTGKTINCNFQESKVLRYQKKDAA